MNSNFQSPVWLFSVRVACAFALLATAKQILPSGLWLPGATFACVYGIFFLSAGLWASAPGWRWTLFGIPLLSVLFLILPDSISGSPWFLLGFQVVTVALWSCVLVKDSGWSRGVRAIWTIGFLMHLLYLPPVPVAKQLAFFGLVAAVTMWFAAEYAGRSAKAAAPPGSALEDRPE